MLDIFDTKNTSTFSNKNETRLDINTLKAMAMLIEKKKTKPLPKKLMWFSRIMNHFGWHREYEVIIINEHSFGFNYFISNSLLSDEQKRSNQAIKKGSKN